MRLIKSGRNPENVKGLLGHGTEGALYARRRLRSKPDSPLLAGHGSARHRKLHGASSHFIAAMTTRDATMNPNCAGGLPFDRASAETGKEIADYSTQHDGDTIKLLLRDER